MKTGAAQQRIIQDSAKGGACGQLIADAAANYGKDVRHRKAIPGKEPISRTPVLELSAGSSQQTGHGVTSEAEQRTQREGLRAVGDAALVEGGCALAPELLELREDAGAVFFRTAGGASRRRSASNVLSSTSHSTVSPRENSMACAMAEGKLMYHCSLALRLMS